MSHAQWAATSPIHTYRLSTTINIIYAFMILWWWWQFRNCDNWQSAQFNLIQCATRYNLLFARDFCYFNTFVALLFYMTFFILRIDEEKRGWKCACSTIFLCPQPTFNSSEILKISLRIYQMPFHSLLFFSSLLHADELIVVWVLSNDELVEKIPK